MNRKQIIKAICKMGREEIIRIARAYGLTNLDASSIDLAKSLWAFGYRAAR